MFDESIWKDTTHMATIADTELIAPRICQTMTKRSNIPTGFFYFNFVCKVFGRHMSNQELDVCKQM